MRHLLRAGLVLTLPVLLSACADPLRDVERLEDVEVADGAIAAAAIPPPEEQADAPGLLSRIFGGTLTTGPTLDTPEAVNAAVLGAISEEGDAAEPVPVSAAEPVEIPGTDAIEGDTEMEEASRPEEPAPRRRGLFGVLDAFGAPPSVDAATSTGPDAQQIAPGTALAYGEIATVCAIGRGDLGRPIAEEAGYTVYDTNPSSTALRTHYITGFDDGCPRQVSAALVLLGDVAMHETIRYSAGTADIAYTETDVAYEEIKARVCGVGTRQPCGSAIDRLARRTAFVTVYANFGANPEWADVLLSEGRVIAMDFKG